MVRNTAPSPSTPSNVHRDIRGHARAHLAGFALEKADSGEPQHLGAFFNKKYWRLVGFRRRGMNVKRGRVRMEVVTAR